MPLHSLLKKIRVGLSGLLAITSMLYSPLLQTAYAADLTALSDTMSRLKASTLSNHDIVFTSVSGVAAGEQVNVTFSSGFSTGFSLDFTDVDLLDDGVNVDIAASPSGATWGFNNNGVTALSFTNGTTPVAAGSVIRIKVGTNATHQTTGDQQVTNPSSSSTGSLSILSGGSTDSGIVSVFIITDERVVVTATVAQTISFAISDNTIGFGALSSSNDRYATGNTLGADDDTTAHTLIAATNAASGYSLTLNGSPLTSSAAGNPIINSGGGTPLITQIGLEQFGLYLSAAGGSGAAAYPYSTASSFAYDTASFPDLVAQSATPSTATTYSVHYVANIASATEAGAYTTTLTYIMTANF